MGGEVFKHSGTAQMQWDVLKANDYKVPETLDEFETMLKDYMAENPTTDDGHSTIGLTLSASDWHWIYPGKSGRIYCGRCAGQRPVAHRRK